MEKFQSTIYQRIRKERPKKHEVKTKKIKVQKQKVPLFKPKKLQKTEFSYF